MNAANTQQDAFSQLDELSSKRQALEKLVELAVGIGQQRGAFADLSLIARPSQEFPAKIATQLQPFIQKHGGLSDDELQHWLETLEQTMQRLVSKVSALISIELSELRGQQVQGLTVEGFKALIAEFEQHTHTSLALRYLLKTRGKVLTAFKLPFAQESIVEQVENLREQESRCIGQIKREAQIIIDDTRALLANPALPAKIQQQLRDVEQDMSANITHLDQGGSVSTIPHKFEVVVQAETPDPNDAVVDAMPPPVPAPKPTPHPPASKPSTAKTAETPVTRSKKRSFFGLLWLWLTTPMGTSWRQLKRENQRKR